LRSTEAGHRCNAAPTRVGLDVKSPPQLGQSPDSGPVAHGSHQVHSNEQIIAAG
jgi:hypothetical protein